MKKIHIPVVVAGALMLTAWGTPQIAAPSALTAPAPIEGSAGRYASPFTSDGVTAGWVTKSMQVKAAGQIGSMAGNYAGQTALEQVPFVGGFLGKKAGAAMGRGIALKAIGGEEFLRSSTDLSFNSLNDMALYMYVNYSANPEYQKILDATYAIYPEFQTAYLPALQTASVGK
ncbi:hypothetical protein [Phenylobacterium sp.]|uniref:hypothetical protein n=1 Tax=Phenylobacterium sp. TaxID=1871053 RepID=UPI00272088FE|nr:hypothetical protein [Phenylobacterium sp.]MDO8378039.1 hypothetical protein [Phenylobacterium sp.]